MRTALRLLAALPLLAVAPAGASNGKTPPGNPCAKGNGNPCNGNNGNDGAQGNARKERVVEGIAGPINVAVPFFTGRGVYVTQIGSANVAAVTQTAGRARADVAQYGDSNNARIDQRGAGASYAGVTQSGTGHRVGVVQDGSGLNTLFVDQRGAGNTAQAAQASIGAIYNGAVMSQSGTGNSMSLTQGGEGNRALLTQDGARNAMTAAQYGSGNRLEWTQQGNGLSDLGITQTSGQALSIHQTGGR